MVGAGMKHRGRGRDGGNKKKNISELVTRCGELRLAPSPSSMLLPRPPIPTSGRRTRSCRSGRTTCPGPRPTPSARSRRSRSQDGRDQRRPPRSTRNSGARRGPCTHRMARAGCESRVGTRRSSSPCPYSNRNSTSCSCDWSCRSRCPSPNRRGRRPSIHRPRRPRARACPRARHQQRWQRRPVRTAGGPTPGRSPCANSRSSASRAERRVHGIANITSELSRINA